MSEIISLVSILISQIITVYCVMNLSLYSIPIIMIACIFTTISIVYNQLPPSTYFITIVGLQYCISLIMDYLFNNNIPKLYELIGSFFLLIGVIISIIYS